MENLINDDLYLCSSDDETGNETDTESDSESND